MPNTNSFVTKIVLNTKVSEVENKIRDNSKYVTTQQVNKLTTDNFEARLKQAESVNETDLIIN